jgi:hypothetical protein
MISGVIDDGSGRETKNKRRLAGSLLVDPNFCLLPNNHAAVRIFTLEDIAFTGFIR